MYTILSFIGIRAISSLLRVFEPYRILGEKYFFSTIVGHNGHFGFSSPVSLRRDSDNSIGTNGFLKFLGVHNHKWFVVAHVYEKLLLVEVYV